MFLSQNNIAFILSCIITCWLSDGSPVTDVISLTIEIKISWWLLTCDMKFSGILHKLIITCDLNVKLGTFNSEKV